MYSSANHLANLYQTPCELLKTCEILRPHCDYSKFKSSRMWNFVFGILYSSYVMEAACFSEEFYGTRRFITALKSAQASPYHEPNRSSPCFPITHLEDPFLHYPPIHAQVFQVVSFPQDSTRRPFTHLSCLPCVLHALRIFLLDLIARIIW